jgi:hypothetical protein
MPQIHGTSIQRWCPRNMSRAGFLFESSGTEHHKPAESTFTVLPLNNPERDTRPPPGFAKILWLWANHFPQIYKNFVEIGIMRSVFLSKVQRLGSTRVEICVCLWKFPKPMKLMTDLHFRNLLEERWVCCSKYVGTWRSDWTSDLSKRKTKQVFLERERRISQFGDLFILFKVSPPGTGPQHS